MAHGCEGSGGGATGEGAATRSADVGRAPDLHPAEAGRSDASPRDMPSSRPDASADAAIPIPIDANSTPGPSDARAVCDAAPPPPECYDLLIDPRQLGVEDEVDFRWPNAPRRHFLVDERGFHFGGHMIHTGELNNFEQWPGEVALATFDRASKRLTRLRRFDVLDAAVCLNCRDVRDMALAPDGTFAILYYYEPSEFTTAVRSEVVVGHLDREGYQVVRPLPDSNFFGHAIDWDGEAFAVHGNGVLGDGASGWLLTRIATDGTIVLPPRPLRGYALNDPREMHYATDPVSGRTYSLTDGRTSDDLLVVCVHDRAGDVLASIGQGCVEFGPLHDGDQANVRWGVPQFGIGIGLQETRPIAYAEPHYLRGTGVPHVLFALEEPVSSLPPAVRALVPFDEPAPIVPSDWHEVQLLNRLGAPWPRVLAKTKNGIERITFEAQGRLSSELLLWSPADRCSRFRECPQGVGPYDWGRAVMTYHEFAGQPWLGIGQAIPEEEPLLPSHTTQRGIYRILSAEPGCQYVHAWDIASGYVPQAAEAICP
jgi:hypothetical protein